ncbi:hypothetical protein [Brucella pseudintermedia]
MVRTAKKAKAVTVATAENAATDAEIRSVGDVAAEVVAEVPAPEPEPVAETASGTEIFIP